MRDNYYLLKVRGKELPKIYIENGKEYYTKAEASSFFPDLILSPNFMINNEGASVLDMYCPDIAMTLTPVKNIRDNSQHMYFSVKLPLIKALSDETIYDKSGLYIEKFVLDDDSIANLAIFQIVHVKARYTFVRLDMAESLLRRGLTGFTVEAVEVLLNG